MSLNAARALPAPVRPARAPQRRLHPVEAPAARRRPKLVYALIALAGALAIGAAQIGLSLAITQDSYALASLNKQQRELDLQTHALQEELTGLSSPQVLAENAAALGMVVAGSPAYLRLSDGLVIGDGSGAAWQSTIDPAGAGAVGNALIDRPQSTTPPGSEQDDTEGAGTESTGTELPPSITDGLPSPTTH